MRLLLICSLLLHVFITCQTFYASPIMKVTSRSLNQFVGLKQLATILNVTSIGNWSLYMELPLTNGSIGSSQIQETTIDCIMSRWSIPSEFLDEGIRNVKLLIFGIDEGSSVSQLFIFDTKSGISLSTLLIEAKRLNSSSIINVNYIIINSNAMIKQQYTHVIQRNCHRCANCFWRRDCCCEEQHINIPRGITLEEINMIKNQMKIEQFIWLNQQISNKTIGKRSLQFDYKNISLNEIIEKYFSNNKVKEEIYESYNDTILSTLQSSINSLKFSSQILKLTKIDEKYLSTVLLALSKDYQFEFNKYFKTQFSSKSISYENLYTISKKRISMKYIWILAQKIDNSSYSIEFLCSNITSEVLINTLLSNQSKDLDTNKQQFNIIRISKFNQYGEFFDENLLTRYPLWKSETTKIVLNMFRFIAAVKLNPEKPRLLSAFFENQLNNNNNHHHHRERRGAFLDKVNALSNAVKNAAEAWKSIAGALKTSTSKTIERTTRFGFTYFQQKSTVLQVMNIPSKRAEQFLNAIQIDYDLPTKASFMLGLTYSEQFAWERVDYLYSPTNNGKYRFLTLYKNADRINKTASFFLVDINSDWQIANDLLIVKKSRSVLGGLFENTKQYIQEIPHVLTVEEADQLRQFFTLVSMSHLASILRVNVTLPQLNQTFSK